MQQLVARFRRSDLLIGNVLENSEDVLLNGQFPEDRFFLGR